MYYNNKEVYMANVSLRLNEEEDQLFRSYSKYTGKSLSELFKSALAEKIEDQLDYEIGINALDEFNKNPETITIDQMIGELESDL